MEEIAMIIEKYGLTAVLTTYFLYKDWKTTQSMLTLMGDIKIVLTRICTIIGVDINDTQNDN